jgi:His Kinase A (phospho-acceptor) domain
MSAFSHPRALHSALHSASEPLSVPTILACPLPLSLLPPEELLPELGHELKTPLSGIMGLAQVMQRQAGQGDWANPTLRDRNAQYASLIHQKSQQLLIAINDLLDLTQLCTHQFILQLQAVEFHSAFNTALQVAQRIAGQTVSVSISQDFPKPEQGQEQWIVADRVRVEQLLIHLLGYLLLQSPLERTLALRLTPWGRWICLTLNVSSLILSDNELISLGWAGQPSLSDASATPYRSGTMLKFLLARRLAHLQGAEMTWRSDAQLGTEVTVLFPRDLTHTTTLSRSPIAAPLWMILAQKSTAIQDITQVLQSQKTSLVAPLIIARSLPEAQEKIQLLSPTVLIISRQFAEACGLSVLQSWLAQQRFDTHVTLVWIGDIPLEDRTQWPYPIEAWSLPLSSETLPASLNLANPTAQSASPAAPKTSLRSPGSDTVPRPLTLLQADSPSATDAPSPAVLELLAQLSQRYGCSTLSVNDANQAELLVRIWKPQAIICPGTLPEWVAQLSKESLLAKIPIFLFQEVKPPSRTVLRCIPYAIDTLPLKEKTDRLYRQLIEAATAQDSADNDSF